jgi:4-hydroxybenzoate polyprenyltransferase
LAITFNWGVIIAFAAVTDHVPLEAWIWLAATAFWTLAYDTQYALCDEKDDRTLGLHSSAIYFDQASVSFIIFCQIQMVILLIVSGYVFDLNAAYWILLPWVMVVFMVQYRLVKKADEASCFRAFKSNHWVGLLVALAVFLGTL